MQELAPLNCRLPYGAGLVAVFGLSPSTPGARSPTIPSGYTPRASRGYRCPSRLVVASGSCPVTRSSRLRLYTGGGGLSRDPT
jgi:hypothetical protein